METPEPEQHQARVRRAPKFGVFILIGAVCGALGTLVLTSMFPADPMVGFAASYGYFLIYGIPLGVLVGALIALGFDLLSRLRSRTVTMSRKTQNGTEEPE